MTLAGEVFDEWVKGQSIKVIEPNQDALVIVRLFLEKLEQLSQEERKEILAAMRFLANPLLMVDGQHAANANTR